MTTYKIGDFAAHLGVTPDLLKHYEKYNIISSEKRGDGGYRFYDFTQAPIILESKKYHKLGFTLREIEHLLYHAPIDFVVDSLTKRTDTLAAEMKDKQLVFKHAQNLCKVVLALKNQNFDGKWSIGKFPAFYFFPHSTGYNFAPNSKSALNHLSDWINFMPVVEQCARIFYDPKEENKLVFGLSINEEDAEALKLYVEDPVEKLAEGWGLVYQSTQPAGCAVEGDFIGRILRKPLQIIEKHNLTPNGDICLHTVFETVENGEKYYHRIIRIPLKGD